MDAPWDFDLAYGLANWSNASQYNDYWDCPTGTGTSDFMVINSSCPWFKQLYSFDEFNYLSVCQFVLSQEKVGRLYDSRLLDCFGWVQVAG